MTKTTKFQPGQKVMVSHPYERKGEGVEREVVRVGRTLVYVRGAWGGSEIAYYIETGQERTEFSGGRVWTLEEWAERAERAELVKRLREGPLKDTYSHPFNQIDIDKLRRIVAILEEPA